jgi:hypothetical protein
MGIQARKEKKEWARRAHGAPAPRVKQKPRHGTGAESRKQAEIRRVFIAFVRQRLAAYPKSSVNDLRRAKMDAGFDTGTFRMFVTILEECGFQVRNGVVSEKNGEQTILGYLNGKR